MDIATLKSFLLWCAILNTGAFLLWALFLAFARDWVYRMHSKWHNISIKQFSAIHYAGLVVLKSTIFVFFLCPYIVLCIIE